MAAKVKLKRPPPPPEAEAIFRHALSMAAGSQLLKRTGVASGRRAFMASATVLDPLACELLLKCLGRLDGRTRMDGHYLDMLFGALMPNTRSAITQLWNSWAKPRVRLFADGMAKSYPDAKVIFHFELKGALVAHRDIFQKTRYPFDFDPSGNAFAELLPVLITVILGRKPEWLLIAASDGFSPIAPSGASFPTRMPPSANANTVRHRTGELRGR